MTNINEPSSPDRNESHVKAYLLRLPGDRDLVLDPEALRRLFAESGLSESFQVFEQLTDGQQRALGPINKLAETGGLVLWFKNCTDAREAFDQIKRSGAHHPPPIRLMVELADLDCFEMSHCIGIRSRVIFERVIDHWLGRLDYQPTEEETEQGSMVIDYFNRHAKIQATVDFAP